MSDPFWDFGPPTDDIAAINRAALSRHTGRRQEPTKRRSGATPEAKVAKACVAWLEGCGFYVLRTGAGLLSVGGRKIKIGRDGGHDYTCCAPNGRYVSMEVKRGDGEPSDAQLKQREYILRRNGIVTIPHSLDELKADMHAAFGTAQIAQWQAEERARQAGKQARRDALMRKNGQIK